jgi:hypothetical protein
MSNALDFGASNTTRYYSLTGPSLETEWGIWFWTRRVRTGNNQYGYAISKGNLAADDSFHVIVGGTLTSGAVSFRAKGASGIELNISAASAPIPVGSTDYLIGVQKRAGAIELYVVAEGSTVTAPTLTASTDVPTSIASGTWLIGARGDLSTARFWENPLGELTVLTGRSLSPSQVQAVAAGARVNAVETTRELELRFRDSTATEADLSGNNYTATRAGTGYTLVGEFFSDSLPAPTLSSPTFTSITSSSVTLGATTDQGTSGSNNLYRVLSASNVFSGVTATQVIAGQNASGSTSGVTASSAAVSTTTPSISVSSLSENTTYYYALVQVNANGTSNVLTGSFTTLVSTRSTSVSFVDGSNAASASLSIDWFLTATWGGSVVASGTTSTNASGVLSLTGLTPAAGSYKLFYKLTSNEDHNAMCPVTLV